MNNNKSPCDLIDLVDAAGIGRVMNGERIHFLWCIQKIKSKNRIEMVLV
jgi:hypothetical protein